MSLIGILGRGFGPYQPEASSAGTSGPSAFMQDTVIVQEESYTSGASFGVNESYTAGSELSCLVQQLDASEVLQYQSQGMVVSHQILFSSEPTILKKNSRLLWGSTYLRVEGIYSEGRPGETLLWIALAQQVTSRREP